MLNLFIYENYRFIRTNMTKVISEKSESTNLEEEYDNLIKEIAIIQQEITNMTNKLNELKSNENDNIVEMNFKNNTIGMQMRGNVKKNNEK